MIEWNIPTMTCGHCASVVTKTVQAADPKAQIQIDLARRTLRFDTDANPAAIAQALVQEGYAPQPQPQA